VSDAPRDEGDQLVFVFMPALIVLLLKAEQLKGSPLIPEDVHRIRDGANSVATRADVALGIEQERGYRDIDPENCWEEFQQLRAQLSKSADNP
jgi:hypothetical protein